MNHQRSNNQRRNWGLLQEINSSQNNSGYQYVAHQWSSETDITFPQQPFAGPSGQKPLTVVQPINFKGYNTAPYKAPAGRMPLVPGLGQSVNTNSARAEAVGSEPPPPYGQEDYTPPSINQNFQDEPQHEMTPATVPPVAESVAPTNTDIENPTSTDIENQTSTEIEIPYQGTYETVSNSLALVGINIPPYRLREYVQILSNVTGLTDVVLLSTVSWLSYNDQGFMQRVFNTRNVDQGVREIVRNYGSPLVTAITSQFAPDARQTARSRLFGLGFMISNGLGSLANYFIETYLTASPGGDNLLEMINEMQGMTIHDPNTYLPGNWELSADIDTQVHYFESIIRDLFVVNADQLEPPTFPDISNMNGNNAIVPISFPQGPANLNPFGNGAPLVQEGQSIAQTLIDWRHVFFSLANGVTPVIYDAVNAGIEAGVTASAGHVYHHYTTTDYEEPTRTDPVYVPIRPNRPNRPHGPVNRPRPNYPPGGG